MMRTALNAYPWLYFPLLHLVRSPRRHLHVRRDTELVIEGYPRSGNTFAVAAFLVAQGRPVRLARHLHAPAQVIRAVQWGIPVLVLLRRPEDAVLSWMVREPWLSPRWALREYVRFYSRLRPYRQGFLLATFEEVTTDFATVIHRLNRRFGTAFRPFEPNEYNLQRVFALIEAMDMADTGLSRVTENTVARPSRIREQKKAALRPRLYTSQIRPWLERALRMYEEALRWHPVI